MSTAATRLARIHNGRGDAPLSDPLAIDVSKPGRYLCVITPDTARAWLELNHGNRRPRRALVEYLSRQIKSGEWRDDHLTPIAFSAAGRLIDGQHRLFAVVEAGEDIRSEVRFGVADSLREYIDTGVSRTLEDRVSLLASQHANRLASQLVTGLFYIANSSRNARPTPDDAREVFSKFAAPITYFSENWKKTPRVSIKPVVCALCELWLRNGEEVAIKFYEALHQNDGPIQQARVLRDWLLRQETTNGGGQYSAKARRMTIGACKAFIEGREVKVVREASWE